jgi:hypothetical protein
MPDRGGMTTSGTPGPPAQPDDDDLHAAPLDSAVMELWKCHRDHARYYASAPSEHTEVLQRDAAALRARAGQSSPHPMPWGSAPRPTQDVVPIATVKRDLWLIADEAAGSGAWLEAAMESSWDAAESLVPLDEFADLLGERHHIIANDWHAAVLRNLVAKLLRRAVDILDAVEREPAPPGEVVVDSTTAERLAGAAQIVGHAADLLAESSVLRAENERRWSVVRRRLRELASTTGNTPHRVDVCG